MRQLQPSPQLLSSLKNKTAIITGSGRGIGAATATLFNRHGANVVITDLPGLQPQANALIESLSYPSQALFVPANVIIWKDMVQVFKEAVQAFGKVDIVVANAALMESRPVLETEVDADGEPVECEEANRVVDVSLKGVLNTLKLGMHYMRSNAVSETDGCRGSIVLVSSTSGYFGTTGNAAYIAAKHGVVGLLRASQKMANKMHIRVNGISPSFTPTFLTAAFGDSVQKAGLETNTPETVAAAIAYAALEAERRGTCCLVAGRFQRELEHTQRALLNEWLGADLTEMLGGLGAVIEELGGYPLPPSTDGREGTCPRPATSR